MSRYEKSTLILCVILVSLGAWWFGTHHTGWALFFAP